MRTQQFRMCDVCRLLDFDTESKICTYCSACDAWICKEDFGNWARRLVAAVKRKLEPGYSGETEGSDGRT